MKKELAKIRKGRLKDKVAIITGGARGMGAAHARKFVEEGARVLITDLLEKEGLTLANELGDDSRFIKHDVTKQSDWKLVIRAAEEIFGPVNILINNAGISLIKTIENTSEDDYRRVVEINQLSVFVGMKEILPSMRRAKGGSIVNISSLAGLIGHSGSMAYVASKFAVTGMTKVAALEYGEYDIRVNSVHPGLILTPMTGSKDFAQTANDVTQTIPLKRAAQPEEVTNLVLFLASDEASYSTGSEFIIDGGLYAQ
ncbi:MAG TPA: glucose 1-dehydrogenase [Flavitalea sp.]|nr:glucose 1-dehydrogenase [Flavitalea sp.]